MKSRCQRLELWLESSHTQCVDADLQRHVIACGDCAALSFDGANGDTLPQTAWQPNAGAELEALVSNEADCEALSEVEGVPRYAASMGTDAHAEQLPLPATPWHGPRPKLPPRKRRVYLLLMVLAAIGVAATAVVATLLLVRAAPMSPPPTEFRPVVQPIIIKGDAIEQEAPHVDGDKPRSRPAGRRKGRRRAPVGKVPAQDSGVAATRGSAPLEVADIIEAVKRGRDALTPCLEQARRAGVFSSGRHRLVLQWVIMPDGRVRNPRLVEPHRLRRALLGRCVTQGMRTWSFPKPPRETPVRNFPFGPFRVP